MTRQLIKTKVRKRNLEARITELEGNVYVMSQALAQLAEAVSRYGVAKMAEEEKKSNLIIP